MLCPAGGALRTTRDIQTQRLTYVVSYHNYPNSSNARPWRVVFSCFF